MEQTNKKFTLGTALRVAAILLAFALFFAVAILIKGHDVYVGGVIYRDAGLLWYLLIQTPVLLLQLIFGVIEWKHGGKEELSGRWKRYFIGSSILFLMALIFLISLLVSENQRSRAAAIAETELGDGRTVLMVESEDHFTTSHEAFYKITIYCRDGIRLKKIGELDEYNYTNNRMVSNDQYSVEYDGSIVTVYYDYGELTHGLKWQDEAPEYIVKEYRVDE